MSARWLVFWPLQLQHDQRQYSKQQILQHSHSKNRNFLCIYLATHTDAYTHPSLALLHSYTCWSTYKCLFCFHCALTCLSRLHSGLVVLACRSGASKKRVSTRVASEAPGPAAPARVHRGQRRRRLTVAGCVPKLIRPWPFWQWHC